MTIAIVGLGSWLPEHVRTNDAWPASFAAGEHAGGDRTFNDIPAPEDPSAAAILARDLAREAEDPFLGATHRRVASDTTTAAEAEAEAALVALADAGLSGADVNVLMSNSIVPDRLMPSTAAAVAERIGARGALALGIDAACASGVAQLDVARAYIGARMADVVLLTQSHLLLRAFPLVHPACPGLGDGATAMVVARGRGGLALRATFAVTHGEHARAVTFVRGQDDASDPPWWKGGGDFRLGSRAPELAKLLMRDTVSYGAATVREAAARAGIDVERIDVLASVQPRGFLPGAIAERLGIARERAVTTYGEIAHVGACGPTFNLLRARKLGRLVPGSIVAVYGQGSGFTRSAALMEVTNSLRDQPRLTSRHGLVSGESGSRMPDLHTLILVHCPEVQRSLEALARSLPWAPSRGLTFAPLTGDVQQATAEHRAREGLLPIGVVARDEPGALAALAGGADEATVFASVDAQALAVFVDRIELRASLRAEGQRLHETFAHAEKLTALGTLVAGIGHEINNPLAAMVLSIDAARRYVLPGLDAAWEVARAARFGTPFPEGALDQLTKLGAIQERTGRDATRILDDIGAAADSIASIVRDLRVFARTDQEEPAELVDVEDLVDQALRLVGRELFHHALLERDYSPDLPKLVVPRNRVTQVIINVLINAAHAIRDVDRPDHRVRISARADDEFVAIAVSDTGPGIAPDSLGRIFDPFYTTKRQELGTGLGLAISRSTLRRIGGDLSVESVYGVGATFLCFLPIPTLEAVRTACQRKEATVRPGARRNAASHSVLVVDDDERVLRSYMRLLNPEHRLLIAQDGGDAIELLESGSAPDAVLLELDLPGVDGRKLLAWMAEHRPDLHRHALVVTSVGSQPEYETFLRDYDGPVLHKPVRGEELLAEIARVLG